MLPRLFGESRDYCQGAPSTHKEMIYASADVASQSNPRNSSGNLGFPTDSSRGLIRMEVCTLHPLRPSWLGASEESGPDDEKGAQKASSCGLGGLGAGDCR